MSNVHYELKFDDWADDLADKILDITDIPCSPAKFVAQKRNSGIYHLRGAVGLLEMIDSGVAADHERELIRAAIDILDIVVEGWKETTTDVIAVASERRC